jgi:hypothetical protein
MTRRSLFLVSAVSLVTAFALTFAVRVVPAGNTFDGTSEY